MAGVGRRYRGLTCDPLDDIVVCDIGVMRRTLLSCAAISMAVFTMTSCGSDDDKADSPTTAPASAGSAPTAESAGSAPTASTATPASSEASETTEGTQADSGDDSPGTVNGTPDPCLLLSPTDIAAVLGDPAPAPSTSIEAEPPLNLRQCEWSVEPTELSVKAIYLAVTTTAGLEAGGAGGGSYTARDQFDGTRSAYTETVDVPGLGDASFFTDADMGELQTVVGDTLLSVSSLKVGSDLEPVTADQLRALMTAAIANL